MGPLLERASAAAGGRDGHLGGGAATVQPYLRAGPVDELYPAVAPTPAGRDERRPDEPGEAVDGYRVTRMVASPGRHPRPPGPPSTTGGPPTRRPLRDRAAAAVVGAAAVSATAVPRLSTQR
ncbi:hypothetical protein ACF9IK_03585 [Kitasatospora hibisci]|uniref:hypothetical protein n=1 Tax=Kitasatospora hibisci TaxID=3369522 RepID=UPI0037549D39